MSEPFADPGMVPAEPVAEYAEEPAWAGPSQEEWTQTQQALGYISEFVQAQQAPPEQGPGFDPFEPNFGEQLSQYVSQAVQQSLEPYTAWQEQQQLGEAEDRALDILEDISSREGEFIAKDKAFEAARALANVFMAEESQKHGFGPKAAESSLQRAAGFLREYEEAVGQAYYERKMNQFSNLSGAPREPTPGSMGAQQVVTSPGGDEMSVVRKYAGILGAGR